MNPFYDLNKKLDGIRNEPTQEQKALVESQAPKSPAKKTLEEALRTDLRSLMEDATGGMSGSNTLEAKQYDPDYDEGMRLVQDYYDGELDFDEFFDAAVDMTRVNGKINPAGVDKLLRHLWDSEKYSEPTTYDMVMRHAQQDREQNNNYDDDDHQSRNDDIDYPSTDIPKVQFEAKDKSLSKAAKTVKKGALHKQEGIPKDEKIGNKKLNSLKKSGTPLEKKRANFALNIQGKGKKKVDESNEELQELDNKTVASYVSKRLPGVLSGEYNRGKKDQEAQSRTGGFNPFDAKKYKEKEGLKRAAGRLAKESYENMDMEECTECMMGECSVHGINELSHGAVVGYRTGAQQDLRKLKQQPVDDFVSNMRQGHRVGDAANMAVQNNLKAIKKAKTRSAGLDRANARIGEEYASEGATPAELTQQTMALNKRQAAIRKNSRDVQRQPAQGGPRRSEIPAFIRKGRGDPGLDYNDLEETDMHSESDKDILDYLKAKLVPNGGNARAKSRPYNGSANTPDAYNGMEFEDSGSRFDKHEVSPGRTQYTRKYDPDTGHSIGSDTGASAPASDGPRKRGRQPGTKFSGGYAARHDGSHVSKAKMDSRKKDMDEDEYSRHTTSKSPAGGTVYTRKYDPDTGHSIGTDTGSSAPASDGPRKRGRQPGTKFSGGYAARHDGSHVSKAKMNSRKKDMDESSATCPHCGHSMADEGREVDMEGVKGGMGSFVKAAKKIGGVASAVKKAKKDYDGDGKIETGPEEHAGSVDKAIKANKSKSPAKPAAKSAAKPADKSKAKPAKKTEEGKGDGNLANNAKPYDKVTQGDVVAGRLGKDEKGGKKKAKKEEKVDETTTSGSVSTAPAKKSSGGGMSFGGSIYDSWERKYANLLKEDVNVTTNSNKGDDGEEQENITITVTGDDVARIKEMLHSMGVSHGGDEAGHGHGGEEACDTCGGVPCQCDEMNEEKQYDPDYDEGMRLVQDYYDGELDFDEFFDAAVDMTRVNGKINPAGVDKLLRHLWDSEKYSEPTTYDMVMRHAQQDREQNNNYDDDDHQARNNDIDYPSKDIPKAQFESDMEETTSFKDAGATIGRIGGTIAGGLGGAAAGLGIGTVPGAIAGGIAGGSAGSALGTAAGRFLDRKTGAPEETDESAGHSEECTTCGGTGEGQHTDTHCYDCHGLGHRYVHNDDNYDDAARRDSDRADGMGRIMQLAGLGEANVTVSDNEPDYPSNQEYADTRMITRGYAGGGGANEKSTGQATLPVVASQVNRLHSHVSEGQRMTDLYKAIKAIENKEV